MGIDKYSYLFLTIWIQIIWSSDKFQRRISGVVTFLVSTLCSHSGSFQLNFLSVVFLSGFNLQTSKLPRLCDVRSQRFSTFGFPRQLQEVTSIQISVQILIYLRFQFTIYGQINIYLFTLKLFKAFVYFIKYLDPAFHVSMYPQQV